MKLQSGTIFEVPLEGSNNSGEYTEEEQCGKGGQYTGVG